MHRHAHTRRPGNHIRRPLQTDRTCDRTGEPSQVDLLGMNRSRDHTRSKDLDRLVLPVDAADSIARRRLTCPTAATTPRTRSSGPRTDASCPPWVKGPAEKEKGTCPRAVTVTGTVR